MQSRKILPALILLIVLVLSAIIWFYPPTGDFRVDNPFWNGLSTLSNQAKITPLNSLGELPVNGKGTVLLLVPYEQFNEADLAQIRSYVSSGGTLALMDDYGYGNQVLGSLDLNIRFTGQALLDPLFDYRSKMLPKITDFEVSALSANVTSIVFNHATALNGTSDVSVVAYSSSFSFLDANNNGVWDEGELNGPFAVAAQIKMGQGYIVAVADPSLLINGMVNLDNNLQFINNIEKVAGSNPQVFVDQSHLPKTSLDEAKADLAIVYGVVASPLGTLSLIAVILALSLKPVWKKRDKHERKR